MKTNYKRLKSDVRYLGISKEDNNDKVVGKLFRHKRDVKKAGYIYVRKMYRARIKVAMLYQKYGNTIVKNSRAKVKTAFLKNPGGSDKYSSEEGYAYLIKPMRALTIINDEDYEDYYTFKHL